MALHAPQTPQSVREQLQVTGSQLLEHAKRLLHAGNIRRIVISQEGRTIAEFPLTVGVVGAVLAPVLAAIGALAALLAECTIEIERVEEPAAATDGRSPGAAEQMPEARATLGSEASTPVHP